MEKKQDITDEVKKQFRCYSCHKLLVKFYLDGKGLLEVKCSRCGTINALVVDEELHISSAFVELHVRNLIKEKEKK